MYWQRGVWLSERWKTSRQVLQRKKYQSKVKVKEVRVGKRPPQAEAEGPASAEAQMCWRAPEFGCCIGCRQWNNSRLLERQVRPALEWVLMRGWTWGVIDKCKAELLYNGFVKRKKKKIAVDVVEDILKRRETGGGRKTIRKAIEKIQQ